MERGAGWTAKASGGDSDIHSPVGVEDFMKKLTLSIGSLFVSTLTVEGRFHCCQAAARIKFLNRDMF